MRRQYTSIRRSVGDGGSLVLLAGDFEAAIGESREFCKTGSRTEILGVRNLKPVEGTT